MVYISTTRSWLLFDYWVYFSITPFSKSPLESSPKPRKHSEFHPFPRNFPPLFVVVAFAVECASSHESRAAVSSPRFGTL
jgi:hypothetical protein